MNELNGMANVRALVITGQGEKFFSAGADLNQFASGDPVAAAPWVMLLVPRLRLWRIIVAFRSLQLMVMQWGWS